MPTERSAFREIGWGAWVVIAIGIGLFSLGVGRFISVHRFGFSDALYCSVAVVPAALLLLVFDYVVHHAPLVSIIPLIVGAALILASPVFDVALGLALAGAIVVPAFVERKEQKRRQRSAVMQAENDEARANHKATAE